MPWAELTSAWSLRWMTNDASRPSVVCCRTFWSILSYLTPLLVASFTPSSTANATAKIANADARMIPLVRRKAPLPRIEYARHIRTFRRLSQDLAEDSIHPAARLRFGDTRTVHDLEHPGWAANLIAAGQLQSGEHVLVVVDEPLSDCGSELAAAVRDAGGQAQLQLWAGERPLAAPPPAVSEAASGIDLCLFLVAGATRRRGWSAHGAAPSRDGARRPGDLPRAGRPGAPARRAFPARARPGTACSRSPRTARGRRRRSHQGASRNRPAPQGHRTGVAHGRPAPAARGDGELPRRRGLHSAARGRCGRRARRRPHRPVHRGRPRRRAGDDPVRRGTCAVDRGRSRSRDAGRTRRRSGRVRARHRRARHRPQPRGLTERSRDAR